MFLPSAPSTGKVVGQSGYLSVRLCFRLYWRSVDTDGWVNQISQPDYRSILSAWPPVLKLSHFKKLLYCFWSMLPSSCRFVLMCWNVSSVQQTFQKIVLYCRSILLNPFEMFAVVILILSTGISHVIVSHFSCLHGSSFASLILFLYFQECFPFPLLIQIGTFKICS